MPPSSVGIKPQFPAIAVIPEIEDCGIMRAAQGSDFPARDGADTKGAKSLRDAE